MLSFDCVALILAWARFVGICFGQLVLAAGRGATNSFCRAPVVRICQFLLLASMKLGCNVKCVTSTEFLMAQNFVTFRGIGRSRKVSFGAIKIVLSISFFHMVEHLLQSAKNGMCFLLVVQNST
jgi:hypothetical protein